MMGKDNKRSLIAYAASRLLQVGYTCRHITTEQGTIVLETRLA
jgi:hypothetical protein